LNCAEKASFLGATIGTAMTHIERDRPDVEYIVVPEGSMVTMEFIDLRVRLWVDKDDKISRVPRIG
jgi:hypothetical protein